MDAQDAVSALRRASGLTSWIEKVDSGLAPELAAYRKRLESSARQSKSFKDSLWGMVDLDSSEMVLVDSPPFQRLRRIKQLGVSYLTYPTAGYSRFEHAIGAAHQAERMLRAVERRSDDVGEIFTVAHPIIRLGALLHDIGHLPFSHISERYYNEAESQRTELLAEVENVRVEVADALEVPKPNVAEVLSLAVALAPSMVSLLTNEAGYTDEQVAAAAVCIVGRPPSVSLVFARQLITNALDADKLDYMFRDALATRVPLAVDLERLLYKLKVLSVGPDEMHKLLRRMAGEHDKALVLGTDLSGYLLAHDLLTARGMLFDRVYLHHKTRAAERVVLEMLDDLGLHPTELLREDDGLCSAYSKVGNAASTEAIHRLNSRHLPRRAFAMSYDYLVKSAVSDEQTRVRVEQEALASWFQIEATLAKAESRQGLRSSIETRVQEVCALLGRADPPRVWLEPAPKPYSIVDPEFYVERPDGSVTNRPSYPAIASNFTRNPQATTFVFSDGTAEDLQIAFIATEVEIANATGIHFGRDAADFAKVDYKRVEELKRQIEKVDADFYSANGRVRPLSAMARTADGHMRIKALVERFQTYNAGGRERKVTHQRVATFLDQFPERLVSPMLDVLERVRFLDREDVGSDLARLLLQDAPEDTSFVPLTTKPEKSGGFLPYHLADLPEMPTIRSLGDALALPGPIRFFDDVIVSGKQSRTVVQRWFNQPLDLPDEANLTSVLPEDQRAALRSRQVSFRFAYAAQEGLDSLRALLTSPEIKLNVDVEAGETLAEDSFGLAAAGSYEDDLRAFLRGVGEAVIRTSKVPKNPQKWNDDTVADRVLGYGNRELAVVPFYNVPTGTITALWMSGEFRNHGWMPLFPRRTE